MTLPLRRTSNQTVLIGRTCDQHRCLMRPDTLLVQIITYLFVYFCSKYGLQVHAAIVMSNHYHVLLTDPRGRRGLFLQAFNACLSRVIRWYWELTPSDRVFEPGPPFDAEVVTSQDQLQHVFYICANPVQDGLVSHPSKYDGLFIGPKHWGKPFRVDCPIPLLSRVFKKTVEITPGPPPSMEDSSVEDARDTAMQGQEAYIAELIRDAKQPSSGLPAAMSTSVLRRFQQKRKKRMNKGKLKPFLGMAKVRAQDPLSPPLNYTPPKTQRTRKIRWIGQKADRDVARVQYRQFLEQYRQAIERLKKGKRPNFPEGADKMARLFGIPKGKAAG